MRPSRLQLVEEIVEGPLHERVEALGRLVEDGQLGIVLECLDDADLLAHAARVVAHRPSQRGRRHLQALGDGSPPDGRTPIEPTKVVEDGFAAHRVVEGDAPGQVADARADGEAVADDVQAQHAGRAARRVEVAEQEPDHRALARTVRSEEAEDLARPHVEIEVHQGVDRSRAAPSRGWPPKRLVRPTVRIEASTTARLVARPRRAGASGRSVGG